MLLNFARWCEGTAVSGAINNSLWLFAAIESVHLLGLCLLGGSILLVDLRLMGFGLTGQPMPRLIRQVRPWLLGAVTIMIVTGIPLFLSEAIKCYYNDAFWLKITTLPFALTFTLLVRARIARDGAYVNALTQQAGAMSIVLWFVVAAAGRWIGFS